jgi:hypothetical protein
MGLPMNDYVQLEVACPNTRQRLSLGLLHSLRLTAKKPSDATSLYARATKGILDDATENFLTQTDIVGSELLPLADVLELEKRCQPHYVLSGHKVKSIPSIKGNKVVFGASSGAPRLPGLEQTPNNEHYFGNIVEFDPLTGEITGVSYCENAEGMAKAGYSHFVAEYSPSLPDDKRVMSDDQSL